MASISPYLNFAGTCGEAFDFYRSVFGGEFQNLTKFSEAPADEGAPSDPALGDLVMHVSLPVGDSALMGSDVPEGTVTAGSSTYVCFGIDDIEEGRRVFERLAEGGEVEMPYAEQFWGDHFGSCTDRYDIKWMVVAGEQNASEQTAP